MTRLIALLAPLLGIGGWVLAALMATNLLSGYMSERTCQTDCVQTFFFSAIAVTVVALLLGLISLISPRNRVMGWLTLILAVPLCGILGGIVLIGTTA